MVSSHWKNWFCYSSYQFRLDSSYNNIVLQCEFLYKNLNFTQTASGLNAQFSIPILFLFGCDIFFLQQVKAKYDVE